MSFVIQARRESFGWYIRKLHLLCGSKIVAQKFLNGNLKSKKFENFIQKCRQNDRHC